MEAQILSELRHPGIISYVDHGCNEEGRAYLAMQWLEGEDLAQRLLRCLFLERAAPAPAGALTSELLVHGEPQLVIVIVATPRQSFELEPPTLALDSPPPSHEIGELRCLLEPYGVRIEQLADGSVVTSLAHSAAGSPRAHALLAAQCALIIRAHWPAARVALVTGHSMLAEQEPLGNALDRAWDLLSSANRLSGDELSPSVILDEASAGLLDTRFEISRAGSDFLPKLWAERRQQTLRLSGLTKKACEHLLQQTLGAQADSSLVARIVEQAAGNALYLEELIRASMEGRRETAPGSVTLACLDSAKRRGSSLTGCSSPRCCSIRLVKRDLGCCTAA